MSKPQMSTRVGALFDVLLVAAIVMGGLHANAANAEVPYVVYPMGSSDPFNATYTTNYYEVFDMLTKHPCTNFTGPETCRLVITTSDWIPLKCLMCWPFIWMPSTAHISVSYQKISITNEQYHNGHLYSSFSYEYAIERDVRDCPPGLTVDLTLGGATSGQCKRTENLVVTLSGGGEVEPSSGTANNTLPLIAAVIDQNTKQPPTNPVQVHISLKADPTSGGHDHGKSDRPRGGIAELDTCESDGICWAKLTDSNDGTVVFNFNAPETSGTYTITATCDGCSNTATKPVDVKVGDLWPIPSSVYYALIEDGSTKVIGSTTEHQDNHHLTNAAVSTLWQLAADFYDFQIRKGIVTPTLLHLNDASLKWGGLFDRDGDWVDPHKEHRRGTVIDVRANSSPGAIPSEYFENFIEMSVNLGVDPHFEGEEANQHFHLRLFNRRE